MWDQLTLLDQEYTRARIIPTYVGSTGRKSSAVSEGANHSHVCGINSLIVPRHVPMAESFPRMWDQRKTLDNIPAQFRIIPTYVGSTLQLALILHHAIQHLVVLCYGRIIYDFLDPQYVLALNSS